MTEPKIRTTLPEKLSYAFGNMGSYILWAFVGVYVTIYVTDCIQPGKELLTLLGTLILVCRVFDALSDILMGVIIENTHSRIGKARLWFGISILPLTIVFFFLFFASGLDKLDAIILISVLYFLFTVIFYTMNNIAFNAMLPRLSNDPYDQSNICTLNSVFTSVGSLVSAFAVTILGALGGITNQSSWTAFTLILVGISILGQAICFFKVKEKVKLTKAQRKAGLKCLFGSKYFYLAVAMFAINYYMSLSISSVGKYYSQYVLGNINYYSLFGSLPMVTMGIGLLLTPFLVRAVGKSKTLFGAIACVLLGNVLGSIFPYSLAVGLTGAMIKGLGSAVVMSQLFTLAPDIVRDVQTKKGVRLEGLAASAASFGCKIGSGLWRKKTARQFRSSP
ncbi:MAG: MFS transporter [Bacilli bacterium]|jgi:GPH family glycoside/pentoside/hexuronide:cation symporter|nr:MFS transporter [Bacilli bacterium]